MRAGDWMQTASGRQFWPLDPRPEEIYIEDIAAALSKLCRYGGHCAWPYSVAQHSVYVSHQVPREHALAALLHDATEAYCADVPRPLKRHLTGYAEIEQRIWCAVAAKFKLPEQLPQCVHDADNAVLLAEKAQIMLPSPAAWDVPGQPAPIQIRYWTADQARDAFLSAFEVLTKELDRASMQSQGAPHDR